MQIYKVGSGRSNNGPKAILKRWREHFSEIFAAPETDTCDTQANNINEQTQENEFLPSSAEVDKAIRALKNHKAPGIDR